MTDLGRIWTLLGCSGSIFKLANSCSLVLTQLGTCSSSLRILLHSMRFRPNHLLVNTQFSWKEFLEWQKMLLFKYLLESWQEYLPLQMMQNSMHNKPGLGENVSHFCLQTFLFRLLTASLAQFQTQRYLKHDKMLCEPKLMRKLLRCPGERRNWWI